MSDDNSEKYAKNYALTLNKIGMAYIGGNEFEKAKKYIIDTIPKMEELVEKSFISNAIFLAENYMSAATLELELGDREKARFYAEKCDSLLEKYVFLSDDVSSFYQNNMAFVVFKSTVSLFLSML
ncbi:MAG: hypothetical protein IKN45_10195 [Lachnospiraceae bacterium]|nr:hypothetical protein [Lachnospiraceae bacterium]